MLVLTRKVNQSVLIGHKIVVQVVETGGRIRLGISAPQSVRVVRAEFAPDGADHGARARVRRGSAGLHAAQVSPPRNCTASMGSPSWATARSSISRDILNWFGT